MSRVFLAYKTVDRDRANVVRAKLEALGVPLFIDQKLLSGDNYLVAINEELKTALAVLVLWTEAAVRTSDTGEPNFVLSEAQRGYARGILVAATFERMALDQLPVPFNLFQASDLSDWIQTGASAKHSEWQKVLQALGKKLNRPSLSSLAIALESDGDELKRKFLRDFPNDPSAPQIAADLEAFERKAFDERTSTARKRIQQRAKDAEIRLRSCREQFESQIAELKAGRDFMPPDPVAALNDNLAMLTDQIETYENTISEQRARAHRAEELAARAQAEIVALKREREKAATPANQSSGASDSQITQLQTSLTLAKQRLKDEPKRLAAWSGLAALIAACLFGAIGRWTAPGILGEGDTAVALAAQQNDLNKQAVDLKAREAAIEAQQNDLNKQAVDLKAREAAIGAQQNDLNKQTADLKKREAAIGAQQNDLNKQTVDLKAREAAIEAQQNDLNKQTADLKAREAAIALMAAPKPAVLVAECDALTAFQHDPDRPQDSGWVIRTSDIMNPDAQIICKNALQTVNNDQILQRRLLVQLGRTFDAGGLSNDAVSLWLQAGSLGSSQAYNALGEHYRSLKDMKNAWIYYKQSADLGNPSALTTVALSLLLPDYTNILQRGDPKSGAEYLQKALNADYYRAYYIAGLAYWDTDREYAIGKLITSWCVKHDNNGPENADNFYFKKTGKHLICQQ